MFYDFLRFFHVMSFVFMSIPLFNLIVVNERVLMGASFNYPADRYMENIISHGAARCYVFQASAFVSGVLLLIFGPLGIEALWKNPVIAAKVILLFILTGMLSYIHFFIQPKIESFFNGLTQEAAPPEGISARLKPYRVLRKRMATICLFIVITIIVLGIQAGSAFNPILSIILIGLAGIFSLRVYKTLIRLGWV